MSAVLAESISSPVGLMIGFFCLLKKKKGTVLLFGAN